MKIISKTSMINIKGGASGAGCFIAALASPDRKSVV